MSMQASEPSPSSDKPPTGFAALLGLARETSSDQRRELLRQVTDAFTQGETRNEAECVMFEDIIETVSPVLSVQNRAEISEKLADSHLPLRRTARNFATDEISVARPVLQRSSALTDEDLIEVAQKQSQDHLLAITKREHVAETVSGALVNYGHDHVVGSLLENDGARINRPSYEKIAERAENSSVLQGPLIQRDSAPLDLINDLSITVDSDTQRKIQARLSAASPEQMREALAVSANRQAQATSTNPQLLEAKCWIVDAKKRKVFGPESLVELLRSGKETHFVVALAHMCGVRIDVVRRAVNARNLDTLALLMKSAEAPRPVFNAVAMLLAQGGSGLDSAAYYAKIYLGVSVEAAQRAMRFWKVREKLVNSA